MRQVRRGCVRATTSAKRRAARRAQATFRRCASASPSSPCSSRPLPPPRTPTRTACRCASARCPSSVAAGTAQAGGAVARARPAARLRPRLAPGDRHPGPRPGRQPRGLHLQHEPRRPPRRLRRLQGAALRRQGRPRVRVLRHDAAVPDQRADLSERPTGVAVLDMTRPGEAGADATLLTPAMQTPHESLRAQREARAARGGDRQPGLLPRHRRRLRPQRGLPQPGAAELAAGRHLRPRERLRARRQHLLRDLARHRQHHRGRRLQPEGADDRRGHATTTRTA